MMLSYYKVIIKTHEAFFSLIFQSLNLALSFNYLKYRVIFEHFFPPVSFMSDISVKLFLDVLPLGGMRNKRHKERDLNESMWLFHGWTEDGILNMDKKPPKSFFFWNTTSVRVCRVKRSRAMDTE